MTFNPLDYPTALSEPQYFSGASAWVGHMPFAWGILEMARPRVFVELGTHGGDSYCAFCQGVAQLNLTTRCTAVDTWQGDPHAGAYDANVLDQLRAYHDPRYGSFSTLKPATFDQAVADFTDGSIDLLHIDGLHTYDAVRHDFETWLSKLSPRAVLLLHDTAVRADDFGVWKLWEELSSRSPAFEFTHCFGLGVLGVGADLPEPVTAFFDAARKYPQPVRDYFAVLGHRAMLIKQVRYWTRAFDHQRQLLNEWRQRNGHPAENAPDASADPLGAIRPIMLDFISAVRPAK